MREQFPEFNKPSAAVIKKIWEEAIFVFDTNVLLSLYRLPQKVSRDLLAILSSLGDRAWIPHQVAMEFYRDRIDVIREQENAYEKMTQLLQESKDALAKACEEFARHPFINCKKIIQEISNNHRKIRIDMKKWKSKHPDLMKNDPTEQELSRIFKDRVGPEYAEAKLKEIFLLGQVRYEKEIPPGYKDRDKDKHDKTGTKKFGDLVMWFQIIDKAKTEKKPVIFITDEKKDDWWWRVKGETVGARHELVKEIKVEADVDFHMYQTDQFISHAVSQLSVKFDKEAIEEVKKLREDTSKKDNDLVKSVESVAQNPLTGESSQNASSAQDAGAGGSFTGQGKQTGP